MNDDMREALDECIAYNRMGGLTSHIIRDIADDYGVNMNELENTFYDIEPDIRRHNA